MRRILLAIAAILSLIGAVATVNPTPASASECTIPGSPVSMNGVHRRGCIRVTITYCLVNTDKFWFSWWVQDKVDPGSDADTAQLWRKWPNGSSFVMGGEDQNSFDWNPNSGYFLGSQSQLGPAGNVQLKWKFSDEPAMIIFHPQFLTTSTC